MLVLSAAVSVLVLPQLTCGMPIFIAGPSVAVDTACSSSFVAFDQALWAIRSGKCDAAVVGGANMCLNPTVSVIYTKIGTLSPDGACKSFDVSG